MPAGLAVLKSDTALAHSCPVVTTGSSTGSGPS